MTLSPSRYGIPTVLLTLAALAGCDSSSEPPNFSWVEPHALVPEPGRHDVAIVDTREVVPGPGLPSQLVLGNSRNNLDVVRHQGRVYLGLRTAPDHFAGTDTRMYVISSVDETTWDYEYEVALGTDIREPRFLSIGSSLFFHFSVLGTDPLSFDPMGVKVVEKTASGWGPISDLFTDDRIVWRTRVVDGVAYATSYTGGAHIYTFDGLPLGVQFLRSTDGRTWGPVGSADTIYEGGSSETDFAWDDAGDLWFVMRTEAYDVHGTGSKICVARGGNVDSLYCRSDPKKYDSPLVFAHDGEIYLVGRRNLTETGYYGDPTWDWSTNDPFELIREQIAYRDASKRCSLWRIDREEVRIAYLLDLPSNGDTCFASMLEGATPDEVILYNYSSDPNGPELTWVQGQEGTTNLYRHVLRFTRR